MKLVSQRVTQVSKYYDDPLKHIEICARVCYKSEDKITETSARKMVNALAKHGHTSTFEHFIVGVKLEKKIFEVLVGNLWRDLELTRYLKLDEETYTISSTLRGWRQLAHLPWYKVICYHIAKEYDCFEIFEPIQLKDMDIEEMGFFTVKVLHRHELPLAHQWLTFRIITDRAIANEIVRHRKFGYSQESTRWINYNGKELEFCEPSETSICFHSESMYNYLIDNGFEPQYARDVLPLCTKTELIMTGYLSDFDWFVMVRNHGKFGKPHPKIKVIASKIEEFMEEYSEEYCYENE